MTAETVSEDPGRAAEMEPIARSTNLLSPKLRLAAAAVLFIIALLYFSVLAFRSATVYYLTVGELQEEGATDAGRLVRVAGKLVPDTFRRDNDPLDASFTLMDDAGNTMPVRYRGEVGQLFFNENSELILEGRYTGEAFDTETLIVKCPSKYVSAEGGEFEGEFTTESYRSTGTGTIRRQVQLV